MTPETKPATVIPVFFVDELINLPNGMVGAHQMANEAEEVVIGLGRAVRPEDGIIYSRTRPASQDGLDGVRLIVLICDMDQRMDQSASIAVAAFHLRRIGRCNGSIYVVSFTAIGGRDAAGSPRLTHPINPGIAGLVLAPLNYSAEQIHKQICVFSRN